MASLRDIKRRITSVKNTRQITRAMKMVAGAKLRRAQERATAAQPYQATLTQVLGRVAERAGGEVKHPLLAEHAEVSTVTVVVIGTDRGLCGSFNGTLMRRTEALLREQQGEGRTVRLLTYGKKARDYFTKRGFDVVQAHVDLSASNLTELVGELAVRLTAEFQDGTTQLVLLAYNEFRSVMSQQPKFPQALPLSLGAGAAEGGAGGVDYKYEPGGQELVDTLLPLYLQTTLHLAFLETEAGEHAARMTAMDSATRNASELIEALTLQYNRARQAAITTEINEIVSGAEAL